MVMKLPKKISFFIIILMMLSGINLYFIFSSGDQNATFARTKKNPTNIYTSSGIRIKNTAEKYGSPLNVRSSNDPLLSITTNGWAWRESDIIEKINASPSYVYDIKVDTLRDNPNMTAIGILERYQKTVSGTQYLVNLFHVFIANLSKMNISGTKIDLTYEYVGVYNHTYNLSDYDRITCIDIAWWNNTTIIGAVASVERRTDPNYDTYHVYKIVWIYNNTTNKWGLDEIVELESGKGSVVGLDITYKWDWFVISVVSKVLGSQWGLLWWEIHASFYELTYNRNSSASPIIFKIMKDVWVSNAIMTDDNYTILFACIQTSEGDSQLRPIYYNIIANVATVSDIIVVDTQDFVSRHGLYIDFKDPTITAVGHNKYTNSDGVIVVVFSGFTEYENYFTYVTIDYSWGGTFNLINYDYNASISRASRFLFADANFTDNRSLICWIDLSTGITEICSSNIEYHNGNITVEMVNFSVRTYTNSRSFDTKIIENDAVLVHASSNETGYSKAYITIGFNDTDRDGLGDAEEVHIYNVTYPTTDYTDPDSDNDGLGDGAEVLIYGTYPNSTDTDIDDLSDSEEIVGVDIPGIGVRRTDPLDPDTDSDNLGDGNETRGILINITETNTIMTVYSDPTASDTDGDGINDYQEAVGGWNCHVDYGNGTIMDYMVYSDPNSVDTDGDGLNDYDEYSIGSDPTIMDTDLDNLDDYEEYFGVNISGIGIRRTDPLKYDTDADGIGDYEEYNVTHTDPTKWDTDDDGLGDKQELDGWNVTIIYSTGTNVTNITTYTTNSSPLDYDSDGDGLSDYDEYLLGSDPRNNDTDSDGLIDVREAASGTDLCDVDTDNDGLTDYEEVTGIDVPGIGLVRTSPLSVDSDGDGLNDYEECRIYNTSAMDPDTDHDGIGDYDEVYIYHTNPNSVDTDADGVGDWDEIYKYDTNQTNPDTDGDGLLDGEEIFGVNITGIGVRQTDPNATDTDGDGLSDYDEAKLYYTDPTKKDTDGDGLEDNEEVNVYWTDPCNIDTDNDNVSDYEEIFVYGINPNNTDTDGDGLLDGEEVFGIEIMGIGTRKTNASNVDTDGDGLSDYDEAKLYYTDPTKKDTDGDGLTDYNETIESWKVLVIFFNGTTKEYSVKSDPVSVDTDQDGLSDYLEHYYRSDPKTNDTDKDGLSDWEEYSVKTNINNADSDYDGISDYDEVNGIYISGVGIIETDPNSNDTDKDGLDDYSEVYGVDIPGIGVVYTNPRLVDTDRDGLSDYEEAIIRHTNPAESDTDGDGLCDYDEIYNLGTSPTESDTDGDGLCDYDEIFEYLTLPQINDTDDDGLCDYDEVRKYSTNPLNPDSDGDDLSDKEEIDIGTDPLDSDTDNDGLSDYDEVKKYGSNPLLEDTDGDGLDDYTEIKKNTDPNDKDTDNDYITDKYDLLLPTYPDFIIWILIGIVLGIYKANTYGLFRNWRKDILAFGMTDLGGVPMFVVPEDFKTRYDISLISSGLLGIHTMTEEITGKETRTLVLAGEIPIFISKGENSIAYAFIKRDYPRLIKQLRKVLENVEDTYGPTIKSWTGLAEEMEEVKKYVESLLGIERIVAPEEVEEISPEVEEEFKRTFGE